MVLQLNKPKHPCLIDLHRCPSHGQLLDQDKDVTLRTNLERRNSK